MAEKPDLRTERADFEPVRADLDPGAEKADLRFVSKISILWEQILVMRGQISGQKELI